MTGSPTRSTRARSRSATRCGRARPARRASNRPGSDQQTSSCRGGYGYRGCDSASVAGSRGRFDERPPGCFYSTPSRRPRRRRMELSRKYHRRGTLARRITPPSSSGWARKYYRSTPRSRANRGEGLHVDIAAWSGHRHDQPRGVGDNLIATTRTSSRARSPPPPAAMPALTRLRALWTSIARQERPLRRRDRVLPHHRLRPDGLPDPARRRPRRVR